MNIDIDSLAQELFSMYYDKNTKSYPEDDVIKAIQDRTDDKHVLYKTIAKLDELVDEAEDKPDNKIPKELEGTGNKIIDILNNYGVKAELDDAKVGPRVTQYEIKLAPGTKINEVSNLSKELAMGLAVTQVSITPVEGKSTLGIQVPNKESTNVSLDSVIKDSDKSGVSMALGTDMNGKPVSADILKLQHILIGGSTGSGKSACINSMLCSLIQQYSPDQVKLVLIDPKRVELSAYKSVPHLLMPIITDPKQAADTLDKLCETMDDRYSKFEKVGVKNIEGYNNLVEKYNAAGNSVKTMPYIIVVIDELADLMMTAGKQVESSIQRLTQLARAAGIHLIVATQRPSVDVVTGTIKNNINSRIAFATPSGTDSRTILDQQGAEKLLGKGDMLYKPIGSSNPIRVQGAFVDDDEVSKIVNDVKNKYGTTETTQEPSKKAEERSKEDANYNKALDIARKYKKISASILMLELHISYEEATRIIDKMQANGLIKGQKGFGRRKIDKKAIKNV